MLSKEALEEYKELYRKHFKVELSDEEVALRANNLLNLYRAVYSSNFSTTPESNKEDKNL